MSEKVLHLGLKILSSIKHSSTGEEIEVIPEYLSMIDKKDLLGITNQNIGKSKPKVQN